MVLQRIEAEGFDGKITIVRDYLLDLRGQQKHAVPFIRFESLPGKQIQIDWGHFGSLAYGDTMRKLYALAVIECYSRAAYVEFTHSQNQQSLHLALLNAFTYLGGSPKEMVVDNMVTAVIERQGSLIRFNDAFLFFSRHPRLRIRIRRTLMRAIAEWFHISAPFTQQVESVRILRTDRGQAPN